MVEDNSENNTVTSPTHNSPKTRVSKLAKIAGSPKTQGSPKIKRAKVATIQEFQGPSLFAKFDELYARFDEKNLAQLDLFKEKLVDTDDFELNNLSKSFAEKSERAMVEINAIKTQRTAWQRAHKSPQTLLNTQQELEKQYTKLEHFIQERETIHKSLVARQDFLHSESYAQLITRHNKAKNKLKDQVGQFLNIFSVIKINENKKDSPDKNYVITKFEEFIDNFINDIKIACDNQEKAEELRCYLLQHLEIPITNTQKIKNTFGNFFSPQSLRKEKKSVPLNDEAIDKTEETITQKIKSQTDNLLSFAHSKAEKIKAVSPFSFGMAKKEKEISSTDTEIQTIAGEKAKDPINTLMRELFETRISVDIKPGPAKIKEQLYAISCLAERLNKFNIKKIKDCNVSVRTDREQKKKFEEAIKGKCEAVLNQLNALQKSVEENLESPLNERLYVFLDTENCSPSTYPYKIDENKYEIIFAVKKDIKNLRQEMQELQERIKELSLLSLEKNDKKFSPSNPLEYWYDLTGYWNELVNNYQETYNELGKIENDQLQKIIDKTPTIKELEYADKETRPIKQQVDKTIQLLDNYYKDKKSFLKKTAYDALQEAKSASNALGQYYENKIRTSSNSLIEIKANASFVKEVQKTIEDANTQKALRDAPPFLSSYEQKAKQITTLLETQIEKIREAIKSEFIQEKEKINHATSLKTFLENNEGLFAVGKTGKIIAINGTVSKMFTRDLQQQINHVNTTVSKIDKIIAELNEKSGSEFQGLLNNFQENYKTIIREKNICGDIAKDARQLAIRLDSKNYKLSLNIFKIISDEFERIVKKHTDEAIKNSKNNHKTLSAIKAAPFKFLDSKPSELETKVTKALNKEMTEALNQIDPRLVILKSVYDDFMKINHNYINKDLSACDDKQYYFDLRNRVRNHLYNNHMEKFSDGGKRNFIQWIRLHILKPLESLAAKVCCGKNHDRKPSLTLFPSKTEEIVFKSGEESWRSLEAPKQRR